MNMLLMKARPLSDVTSLGLPNLYVISIRISTAAWAGSPERDCSPDWMMVTTVSIVMWSYATLLHLFGGFSFNPSNCCLSLWDAMVALLWRCVCGNV
jgi:hypothetical protein